ncbi:MULTISPECIES: CBS domain-containing protein [Metallosphaera]|uniref:CBS domain-containing protein n=1 Tax=Metallosphaera TaxID=41980 RepID=UPI001F0560FB|nr:CBS domain-containing protein [Metallosphaera sedula]MCH1772056.1 CBS domain-containing protein [Metallosphaera sedula]MCP6729868.1 CBS domain-containing protein [Metallosphaera sedula]
MSASELMVSPSLVANSNDKLRDVLNKMKEANQWVVPVVNNKKLVGILSFKELIRRRVNLETRIINVASPVISLSKNDDFNKVIVKFYTTKARAIPVTDDSRNLLGIITREQVLSYLLNSGQLETGRAREFMSSPPVTLSPEDSVAKARWIMVRDNISRIPIVQDKKLVGIVTTRDIVNALYTPLSERKRASILSEEERVMASPLKEIMVSPVITVSGVDPLKEVAQKLLKNKISGAPVMEGDFLSGVISGIDIIKSLESKFQLSMPIEAKLTSGLRNKELKAQLDGVLERYLSKLEKFVDINNFRVSFKEEASSQGRPLYKVSVNISTKIGNFVANDSDRDPVAAVKRAVDTLEQRLIKRLKRIQEKKGDKEEVI